MPKFLVKQGFKGAIRGIHVRDYTMGERVEIDDPDLAGAALAAGWIESCAESAAPEPDPEKAAPSAPKNKAAKAAPKAKDTATE